jgi:type I site-specific restriction-modification system R (restriction) subunit
MGDPKRISLIAADLVEHFEKRLESMDGKAIMVCMSRSLAEGRYCDYQVQNRGPLFTSVAFFWYDLKRSAVRRETNSSPSD